MPWLVPSHTNREVSCLTAEALQGIDAKTELGCLGGTLTMLGGLELGPSTLLLRILLGSWCRGTRECIGRHMPRKSKRHSGNMTGVMHTYVLKSGGG